MASFGLRLAVWLLTALQPIFMPFFIAGLLAHLGDPLTDHLEPRWRWCSVFLGLTLLLGLLVLIVVPQAAQQVMQRSHKWPLAVKWVQYSSTILLPR